MRAPSQHTLHTEAPNTHSPLSLRTRSITLAVVGWALTALCLGGCNGIAYGDRNASLCPTGFDELHVQAVGDALQEWHYRSDGRVNMTVGYDSSCIPVMPFDDPTYVGYTHFSHDVKIDLAPVEDLPTFSAIVLHEVGHYLTGVKHSGSREDIMFPDEVPGVIHLTEADVARLDDGNRWQQ